MEILQLQIYSDYPKSEKELWDPKLKGNYATIICMQKQGRSFVEKTTPRASWYIGKEYFNKLLEKIKSPEDFYKISKELVRYSDSKIDYKKFSKKVDGLLKRL